MAAVLLVGCSGLEQPEVEHVATAFATGDPQARCALLTPATAAAVAAADPGGCTAALGRLARSSGQVTGVSVWGGEAQVRLTDDTLFLTRTENGWKVAAAGCRPNTERPYECRVEGP
jgi:hypothetical protein